MANNIKYRQLKAFCLAAQEGSFIAAARLLFVTQPSFTALIKSLEDELGMQLFERTTRTCHLTAQGKGLYETLSRILADLEEAYQYAKDEGRGLRGKLSIAAVPSLSVGFLAEAFGAFHQRYPSVQIYMGEHNSDGVIDAVRNNLAELGVGRAPADNDMVFKPLFKDRLLAAGVPHHPIFNESHIKWASLAKHELIMIGGGATAQEMAIASRGGAHSVEATHLATAASIARYGLGLAVIPSSAVNALNTEGLKLAPIAERSATRQLGAIYKRRRNLSASARHFIELMEEMAEQSQWKAMGGIRGSMSDTAAYQP